MEAEEHPPDPREFQSQHPKHCLFQLASAPVLLVASLTVFACLSSSSTAWAQKAATTPSDESRSAVMKKL
jgi:hypothetical protein